jgi:hypothetical protein
VPEPLSNISYEQFIGLVQTLVLTDGEVAAKIKRDPPPTPELRSDLIDAVRLRAGGPVTGILRTALRSIGGLPPLPEDLG